MKNRGTWLHNNWILIVVSIALLALVLIAVLSLITNPGLITNSIWDFINTNLASLAIVIGSIWSYILFRQYRETSPRCDLKISVDIEELAGENLLFVTLDMTNQGKVKTAIRNIDVSLHQVNPTHPVDEQYRKAWPSSEGRGEAASIFQTIATFEKIIQDGKFYLEPGEHEQYNTSFKLSKDVNTVIVYAHITDGALENSVWPRSKLINIENELNAEKKQVAD